MSDAAELVGDAERAERGDAGDADVAVTANTWAAMGPLYAQLACGTAPPYTRRPCTSGGADDPRQATTPSRQESPSLG